MTSDMRLPWRWGPDFGATTDKNADCQLYDADGKPVIPIRIDHHEPIWDVEPGSADPEDACVANIQPTAAQRDFILRAVNSHAGLVGACKNAERSIALMRATHVMETDSSLGEIRDLLRAALRAAGETP